MPAACCTRRDSGGDGGIRRCAARVGETGDGPRAVAAAGSGRIYNEVADALAVILEIVVGGRLNAGGIRRIGHALGTVHGAGVRGIAYEYSDVRIASHFNHAEEQQQQQRGKQRDFEQRLAALPGALRPTEFCSHRAEHFRYSTSLAEVIAPASGPPFP